MATVVHPGTGFRLHMCADAGGEKRNIEVTFDRRPDSVAKIGDEAEVIFRNELQLRGIDPRAFSIDFIVFYDDVSRRWRPLETVEQLAEFAQLYLFQTNAANDPIREIPAPSSQATAFANASRRVHRPGISSIDPDKVLTVFKEFDINDSDSIELGEMIAGFYISGIDFNEETVGRLFDKSDANNDGRITWEEFQVFAELFPNTVETLYWRLRQVELEPEKKKAANALRTHRRRENDLRRQLAEMEVERRGHEARVKEEQSMARVLDPRRRQLEDEEQDLINKEFALQFHRDMVCQAEVEFSETAVRFDHAAMRQGSPRRARYLT